MVHVMYGRPVGVNCSEVEQHKAVSAVRLAAYQTQTSRGEVKKEKKVALMICVRVGCGNVRIVHSRSSDDVNGASHLHSLLQSS